MADIATLIVCPFCNYVMHCPCFTRDCTTCKFLYFCSPECPTNHVKEKTFAHLSPTDKCILISHTGCASQKVIRRVARNWEPIAEAQHRLDCNYIAKYSYPRRIYAREEDDDPICDDCGFTKGAFCEDAQGCDICKDLELCSPACPQSEANLRKFEQISNIPKIELYIHSHDVAYGWLDEISSEESDTSDEITNPTKKELDSLRIFLNSSSDDTPEKPIYFRRVTPKKEMKPPMRRSGGTLQVSESGPWKELYDRAMEDIDHLNENNSVYDSVIFHFYFTMRLSCECLQQIFLCAFQRRYIVVQSRSIREISLALEEFLVMGTGHDKHYYLISPFITFVNAGDATHPMPESLRRLVETYNPKDEYVVHFRLPLTRAACRKRGLKNGSFLEKSLLVRLPTWDTWTPSNHRNLPPTARSKVETVLAHWETFTDHPLGAMPKELLTKVIDKLVPMLQPKSEKKCRGKK